MFVVAAILLIALALTWAIVKLTEPKS